ncbi:uncharacterized protein LOC122986677 [Thunnus albacares]|uniref:uncharacterized protein LOC121905832 n=1 Tax=Thunnus maccoyii TaxID=8240 RepID=UPI001C4CFF44|nr:uncharacterized protein LOC121905832 [Thunnus maccoyii]XP_044213910.1 uncharacterized protein LOC122986677 [Thunnus albacares]
MFVPVVVFLSTVGLHSVAAGGVYCAKTARARAAAMGLDYPGVHGAPDLLGPAHLGMHRRTIWPLPYYNNAPNMAHYKQNQPAVSSLYDRTHKHADPRNAESTTFLLRHGTYIPFQSEYTTNQRLSFPRGQSVSNHKSNFEEVKHVAPPTRAEAPGQSDPVNRDPQGRNKPLSFVYNEHDLVVDESVPNRHGMSLSALTLPQSRGHGAYQRGPGLTGYGLGRKIPFFGSSRFSNKGHVSAVTSQGPAVGRLERTRFPGHLAQALHRRLNVKQFVQGNPGLRRLIKPKSGPKQKKSVN